MGKRVDQVVRDIKSLKIQGARNVAKAGVRAIMYSVEDSRAKSVNGVKADVIKASLKLSSARPTEPMLRNYLDETIAFVTSEIATVKTRSLKKFKESVIKGENDYLSRMEEDVKKLREYGGMLLTDGMVVVTHCHSSTVTGVIKEAHRRGIGLKVIACETRPRYQGRITAAELVRAGIDTTITVDMGVTKFLKKADIVLVGADAINSTGDLINKVGTSGLAHLAHMHDVSFFSCAETYKYDPLTLFGVKEKIEQRSAREVWDKPPRKLKVSNPAFDVTAAKYINGYITEEGIVSPGSLAQIAKKKMGE
ncbi:S-methyl-5-thioribose-1-phosphate isomerase [Candidatus Micrarchaeota archaeon]|nr:S-methyl-5-thioribose-1-phosphate isomerase [Candidatus Micrarchaeota archaeon]